MVAPMVDKRIWPVAEYLAHDSGAHKSGAHKIKLKSIVS